MLEADMNKQNPSFKIDNKLNDLRKKTENKEKVEPEITAEDFELDKQKSQKRKGQEKNDHKKDEEKAEEIIKDVEAEGDLNEILNKKSGQEQIKALLTLLIKLLGTVNLAKAGIQETKDGTTFIEKTEATRILHKGEKLFENGTLKPENIDESKDSAYTASEAYERVHSELKQGKTFTEINEGRKRVIAEADAKMNSPNPAIRDTAKRERKEAFMDLKQLNELKAFRLERRVDLLNHRFDFSVFASRSEAAPELKAFAHAKFGLDDHLEIVLLGVDPSAISAMSEQGFKMNFPEFKIGGNKDVINIVIAGVRARGDEELFTFVLSKDGKSYILRKNGFGINEQLANPNIGLW
jgi:hypothetical protein